MKRSDRSCPAACSGYDPDIPALAKEGSDFLQKFSGLKNQAKIEEALAVGEELLDVFRRLNLSWLNPGSLEISLFLTAIKKPETLPRAQEYIRSAIELYRSICPYSERVTKKYEQLMEHPRTQPMIHERSTDP